MNEESLFKRALNLPEAERVELLDRECDGDARLRARVEALLAAHFAANDPTDKTRQHRPPMESTSNLAGESTGTIVAGRYRLLQQIGEGGMGTVWMADQTEPVKRRVAVKLIRVERGMSRTILARFEAERQAIALMDHPNIAKLLDAGTTDEGAPFFVMELVKGVPLNEYCDAQRLGVPERLALFMQICGAVQHAHQKGIIHRDLKPTNILVESHDDKPVPKVIDFGLAKATTGMQLTEHTLFTAFGSVMGTPLYMAPEQAKFNAVDVDTRADVYALGVILYELLTGTTPLTRDTMKKAALDEMLKLIREQEAPTPSSRLSAADALPSVAANRQTEPAKLGRYVKGELDWIVLKALSKERDRRYDSANGFAKDLERFLNHEPVAAGPPTARYRVAKFVRRNRGQVIAASLVGFALLAGIVGTTLGWFEARQQAKLARDAQEKETDQRKLAESERDEKEKARQNAVAERDRADRERAVAEAVRNFVTNDVFERVGDKSLGHATEIRARVLLERAAAKLGDRFKDQPEIELAVRTALGHGFESIGLGSQAFLQFVRVLELCRVHRPKDHTDTLDVLETLGTINGGELYSERALAWFREVYEGKCRTLGESNPDSLWYASKLAFMLHKRNLQTEAVQICERAILLGEQAHGKDSDVVGKLRGMKARITQYTGGYPEAEQFALDALQRAIKTQGEYSSAACWKAMDLLNLWSDHHHYDRMEPLAEVWIEKAIRVFGPESPAVSYIRAHLAGSYRAQKKHLLAGKTYLDVAQSERLILGPTSAWARTCQWRAIEHLMAVSKIEIAVQRAEEWARSDRPDHVANAVSLYGMIVQQCEDQSLAEKSTARAMELLRRAVNRGWSDALRAAEEFQAFRDRDDFRAILAELGKKQPSAYPSVIAALAKTYRTNKEYAKSATTYLEAIRLQELEVAKQPLQENLREALANFHDHLGDVYLDQLDYQNAEKSHVRAGEIRTKLFNESKGDRRVEFGNQAAWSIHNQAKILLRAEEYKRAAAKFGEAYQSREKLFADLPLLHNSRTDATRDLDGQGRAWERAGQWLQAEIAYRKALEIRTAMMNANFSNAERRTDVDWSQQRLAEVLVELGRFADAAEIRRINLELHRKTNPEGVPLSLTRYGIALLKAEKFVEAEAAFREALELREKKQLDDWMTSGSKMYLGAALLGRKKYAEAEPLLLNGTEGMIQRFESIPASDKVHVHEGLDRLIELYTVIGKPDDRKRWLAARAKYPATAPPPRIKK